MHVQHKTKEQIISSELRAKISVYVVMANLRGISKHKGQRQQGAVPF